jgi:hypothetical protein
VVDDAARDALGVIIRREREALEYLRGMLLAQRSLLVQTPSLQEIDRNVEAIAQAITSHLRWFGERQRWGTRHGVPNADTLGMDGWHAWIATSAPELGALLHGLHQIARYAAQDVAMNQRLCATALEVHPQQLQALKEALTAPRAGYHPGEGPPVPEGALMTRYA